MTKDKLDPQRSADVMAAKIKTLLADLTQCMTQETMAVQSNNQAVFGQMSQEKLRLLTNYQSIARELEQNPTLLKQLDDDAREHLKAILAEFDGVLQDNLTSIQAGKNAIGRVITRLLKKAREAATSKTRSYNEKGEMVEKSYGGGFMSKTIKGQLNGQY